MLCIHFPCIVLQHISAVYKNNNIKQCKLFRPFRKIFTNDKIKCYSLFYFFTLLYTRCLQKNGAVSKINKKYYILQLDGAPPHFHRNVRELLNRVLQQRWIGRAENGDNHIHILYVGRIRLSCGCVSCDPGCTY
jgi:hypothetical protein